MRFLSILMAGLLLLGCTENHNSVTAERPAQQQSDAPAEAQQPTLSEILAAQPDKHRRGTGTATLNKLSSFSGSNPV